MKKNGLKWLAVCLLCVSLVLALMPLSGADFGSFSGDSDYGGSDYGGSSWSSSDYDDDYGDSSDGFSWIAAIIVVGVIVVVVLVNNKKGGKAQVSVQPLPMLRPIEQYQELDPQFDAAKLTEKLSNLYVQMQNAWQDKNIESIRPYLSDAFYAQMDRQLDALRQTGQTNFVTRIAVLGVMLNGFCQSDGNDHIYATLNTRIVDYTVDREGKLVSGDMKAEKFMTYRWHLVRPSGMTSAYGEGLQTVECPHCGMPISINQSAKCEYCGSVVTLEEHNFVLTDIQGISQQTVK